uniref:Uncharacterized protein n=1 Tax=Anguilla anguilla TaxID=7936 RepID=A0A0E9T4H6_ANGAN
MILDITRKKITVYYTGFYIQQGDRMDLLLLLRNII